MVRERTEKMPNEPGGILKFPARRLSIVRAWSTGKECWLIRTAIMIPADQIGSKSIRALSTSTCITLHRFHGSEGEPSAFSSFSELLMMQALFKNLELNGYNIHRIYSPLV